MAARARIDLLLQCFHEGSRFELVVLGDLVLGLDELDLEFRHAQRQRALLRPRAQELVPQLLRLLHLLRVHQLRVYQVFRQPRDVVTQLLAHVVGDV